MAARRQAGIGRVVAAVTGICALADLVLDGVRDPRGDLRGALVARWRINDRVRHRIQRDGIDRQHIRLVAPTGRSCRWDYGEPAALMNGALFAGQFDVGMIGLYVSIPYRLRTAR